jgi:hypothetical protein
MGVSFFVRLAALCGHSESAHEAPAFGFAIRFGLGLLGLRQLDRKFFLRHADGGSDSVND